MARFDAYRNPDRSATATPYLIDVQSDVLDGLNSRVVVPLRRRDQSPDTRFQGDLMPELVVEGVDCLLETPKLAAVPRKILKDLVDSMPHEREAITRALDFLFRGY